MFEGLSTHKKYIVAGFPKCGQISLVNYLTGKGFDVGRFDQIWRTDALDRTAGQHPDRIPIIITRDKVEMIWSSYWYWPYNTYMSLPTYLKHYTPTETSLGDENPIHHAQYEEHIAKFDELNPILFKFEDLIKLPNFPHDNKTVTKPQITLKQRGWIEKALEDYKVHTPNP